MRIILDVNHPGDVHFIKNLYFDLIDEGHEVLVTASKKPLTFELLDEFSIPYIALGSYGGSNLSKAINLIWLDFKMLILCLSKRPNAMMGTVAFRIAHIGWLLRIRNYCFDDTQHATEQIKLIFPFAYRMLTAPNYVHDFGEKHIRYEGYHELAYLHPNRFKANEEILDILGVKKFEVYSIIRFVAWNATHDKGMAQGFSDENKIKAVLEFERFGKVFITSEKGLPKEIADRAIKIPISRIHDAIAFSSLVFGESSTMSSEASCLGVPSVYIDDEGRCYTDEQETKYGLVTNYKINDQLAAIKKGTMILKNIKTDIQKYEKSKNALLNDKIDMTAFQKELLLGIHN